jgi:TRAP-type C4-dicarboxylate transport system permease small subunit
MRTGPSSARALQYRTGGIKNLGSAVRRALDLVYLAGGVSAAACLVLLLTLILGQMAARWWGFAFPGSTEYAGYAMAGVSFFALARTLNRGGHIRVSLVLSRLGRYRRFGEIWCLAIGTALSFYLAWFTLRAVVWSYSLGDISQGQDATPLWIPQSAMAAGSVLLAIAFADNLLTLLFSGRNGTTAGPADTDQAPLNGANG